MKFFSKVLVPIDFSAHSTEAIRVAADLARRFEARVTLLHVYEPLVYGLPDGFVLTPANKIDELLGAIDAQLDSARQQAIDAGAAEVDAKRLEGAAAAQIVEFAARGAFDLIVMGTHGRTGISHFLMGSTAERVVRLAPCPVLTVKRPSYTRAA